MIKTSMEKQYWYHIGINFSRDIKRIHFNIVIFFKKATFYYLYEGDAGIIEFIEL
jgi:hypothetical protein